MIICAAVAAAIALSGCSQPFSATVPPATPIVDLQDAAVVRVGIDGAPDLLTGCLLGSRVVFTMTPEGGVSISTSAKDDACLKLPVKVAVG